MDALHSFIAEHPTIQIIKREDADFTARRKIYNAAIDKIPLAVAIPKSADEVASIVKFASRTGLEFSIRGGGHDLFGRSVVENALVIDVRTLNSVVVNKESGTATIGGGVQSKILSKALADHGCITPCPNIATVGYIGYATTGGYGQMAHKYGLGVDHLLSAKIVDANGDIVTADEDTMKGIRGAGGNFGIIVEATIKIYDFCQILAGVIIFESADYKLTMSKVQAGMEKLAADNDLPDELDLQPFYSGAPPGFPAGKIYGGMFMWAGPDIERGRQYLEKVASFHPVILNTVAPASMMESLERTASLVPETSYMNSRAINVRRITPKIYDILIKAYVKMPTDPAAMLTWHEVRASSPSFNKQTSLPSVFNARESHYVIEVLANAIDRANFEAVSEWGLALRDELVREASGEVINAAWLASTPTNEIGSLEKLYGVENARFLREMKQKKDPKGVFRHALPDLSV